MHEPGAAALRALLSDTDRLHRLRGPAVGGLLVERFMGHEALNRPYEWRVQVLCAQADLPLEVWLDTRADLLTVGADGRVSRVSGLIAQARALASDGGLAWHPSAKRAVAAQVPSPQGEAGAAPAEDYDPAGAADPADTACAQERTRLLRQAAEGQALRQRGRATVRGTRAGQWWRLSELPGTGSAELLLTELTHVGFNNLPKDLQAAAERLHDDFPGTEHRVDPAVLAQARSSGYAHQWQGQPRTHPWRPVHDDGTGARWAPKPTAAGPQSALVVGPDGQPQAQGAQAVYTDRLGRIRVRFHWQSQRDERDASSDHSVWVRVAQRWAGAGMGQHFIPRIGQEVLVDFLDGDLDRP
ncbi:MAG: phage baseplate assembly protein V, partial [Caldimonas sp.]|uniref:phage baseplate assembly protein V n=1 Tax=Caldimonas sp. TaxID=2838790 RepID=UPI00391ACE1C